MVVVAVAKVLRVKSNSRTNTAIKAAILIEVIVKTTECEWPKKQ